MPRQLTPAGVAIVRNRDRLVSALPSLPALADGSEFERRVVEVADLPTPLPSATDADIPFGFSRVDASGRICDTKVFTLLGWTQGTALAVSVLGNGLVHLRPATAGDTVTETVLGRSRLGLSQAVRYALGATAGASALILPDPSAGAALLAGGAGVRLAFAHLATTGFADEAA